jgi:predicted NBD/HSP70 family sugar kinase
MAGANRKLIRAINQFSILNTIRTEGLISRVEIADVTGQSRTTVTEITAALIKKNLIIEKKSKSLTGMGRRRIMLALNPEAAHVIGVKVSAHHISFAVTNMQADVKSSLTIPIRTIERPIEFIADTIEEGITHCVREARLDLEAISGIGIGIPGFVDSRTGICFWTPLYSNTDVSLRDLVYERLKIDTYIENNGNTITLGEQWFGAGRGIDNFLVVAIDHGLRIGIVSNGQIHRGARGISAEFGHIIARPDGYLCRCGKRGCYETYIADISILNLAKKACEKGLWKCDHSDQLSIEDVNLAAQNGEPVLQKLYNDAGVILGEGVSGLIQVFNPNKIIICGSGVRAGDMMFTPMRQIIEKNTNREFLESMEIVIQKWQDTDWARGAASLVLQELYKSPFNRIKPII